MKSFRNGFHQVPVLGLGSIFYILQRRGRLVKLPPHPPPPLPPSLYICYGLCPLHRMDHSIKLFISSELFCIFLYDSLLGVHYCSERSLCLIFIAFAQRRAPASCRTENRTSDLSSVRREQDNLATQTAQYSWSLFNHDHKNPGFIDMSKKCTLHN